MTDLDRLPPVRGLYPSVTLGDGRWEAIVKILRAHGTKQAGGLADQVDQQVQNMRNRKRIIAERSKSPQPTGE